MKILGSFSEGWAPYARSKQIRALVNGPEVDCVNASMEEKAKG